MPKKDQAKAELEAQEKGEVEPTPSPDEQVTPPTPEPELGEGKPSLDELQQQLKTTQGMLKQAQGELSRLKKQDQDFGELRRTVEQQTETLTLVMDVMGSMAEGSEELQTKITKSREEAQKRGEEQKKFHATFNQMGSIAQIAEMQPQDEVLKPAFDALYRGDHQQALHLTTLAVQAKVSAATIKKPSEQQAETKEKQESKKTIPVHTGSSQPPQDWRHLSPKEKIKEGFRIHKEER